MVPQAQRIGYWDCNVMVGLPPSGVRVPCADGESLLREMNWNKVDGALIYHAVMAHGSPLQGTQLAVEAAAASERLHATWALLPPSTGETPTGDTFFAALREHGVHALWAFPSAHRYGLNRLTMGTLLDEVAERRIPLLVPCAEGWAAIAQTLADYPDLVVVAVGHGPWGEDRYFRPLLETYANLNLDISRYELSGGVAKLVAQYGAERLLYGSGYPRWSMGGPRFMLARAEITDHDRALIAGENLSRLLREAAL